MSVSGLVDPLWTIYGYTAVKEFNDTFPDIVDEDILDSSLAYL
jgi:hypothetical protein